MGLEKFEVGLRGEAERRSGSGEGDGRGCAVNVGVEAACCVAICAEKVSKAEVKMASGATVGSALAGAQPFKMKAVRSAEINVE